MTHYEYQNILAIFGVLTGAIHWLVEQGGDPQTDKQKELLSILHEQMLEINKMIKGK